jgi:branched-chain amino acid aminotransferase
VLFDTSRTFNGKVFRLRDHLERLYRSLKYTRIDPGMSLEQLNELTLQVVARNEPTRKAAGDDYQITQIISRGQGGPRASSPMKPNVAVWIDPMGFERYAPLFESGAHVVIAKTRSYSPEQLDPKVKHYSRLNFVLADLESTDVDPAAFPLLLDVEGNISESIGANFFVVTNGALRTPGDKHILQGVSRMTVFDLARQLGIPVSEEDLQPYDVYTADEAFLTSTPYCVLPVGRADNRKLGGEVPGPVTRQLLAAWSEMVGVDIVDQMTERAKALR